MKRAFVGAGIYIHWKTRLELDGTALFYDTCAMNVLETYADIDAYFGTTDLGS
jgi:hypothetical protein